MTAVGPELASPLVSTQWLADHLGAENFTVLDATVLVASGPHGGYVSGHEQYILTGHIPGAQFADLLEDFSDTSSGLRFTKPGQSQFESAAGALGVNNETTIVVYDSAIGQWASRLWWLFRSWGYDGVAVLDGGLAKWNAEGRETDIGHSEPTAAIFHGVERPELWADKAYVKRIVRGEENASLVCAVPPTEFSGETGSRARAGHIPGSLSVPAGRLVDRDSNAYLGHNDLRERFSPALDGNRIVAYCAAGIAAASDALVLTLLGERNVAIYDGSLNEWAADPESALVVGA
ncbi:rhodanese-like domain-containing protein [Glaciihabitans sp. UYNi722]|uniref:sulfurtransferase n=1 Tax=Glaciihabitans sp. UYNi722 TaxID=3156344 RepID=UPI003395D0A6